MTAMSDLLSTLNQAQRDAVLHPTGPALVLAGAGSGKTRVLTTRVAWLIQEQHVDPSSILLVTFTNKAAQEMNKRVVEQTGFTLPFAGTFHRISAKILRRDGHHIGLAPNFVIYDTDDQLALIKQIYKSQGLDPKEFNPKAIKNEISKAKNELRTWTEYEALASGHFQEFVARVYKLYQRALKEQQAVDFDDLLMLLLQLLVSNKEILAKYQTQIAHVLVDEYQDTNKAQYELTKLFTKPQNNLFVVGDFAQSIYAWRGADYRNMMLLRQEFGEMAEYKLEQNYRSTQNILDAATNVISKTTAHDVLKLWTENPTADKLTIIETQTGDEEARQVIDRIRTETKSYDYRDMVVLYRTNAQSRPFEEALVRAGIPYRLVGGFKFYERKEIKDLLAYLRVYVNPADTVSQERATKLGKRRYVEFETWRGQILNKAEPPTTPYDILQEILTATHYLDTFDSKDPEDVSRIENVQELLNVAAQFQDPAIFLENVALVQDDYLADAATRDQANVLTLMSLHSVKGLEYPVVFMVGMEEGLLPHSRSLLDKEQMEEERRLCYVGITRAKEKLYLTYARQRWVYGTTTYALRSRFVSDIPKELINEEVLEFSSRFDEDVHFESKRSARWGQPPAAPKPTGRHLVIDDSELEGVLSGEIDIKAFLDS